MSNELVAASCAAVLTVYAAGYWRTRDEARRIEAQAEERRAARTAARVAVSPERKIPTPEPAAIEPPPPPAATAAPEPAPAAVAATAADGRSPEKPAEMPVEKPAEKPTKVAAAKPAVESTPAPAAAPAAAATSTLDSVELDFSPDPDKTPPPPPGPLPEGFPGWRDGTYTGWGQSYHGDIEAEVVIEGGRIVRSGIATCATRYPCDVIWKIIFQPVVRQSPEVDRVSRATESADAYYYGLVEALKQAELPAEAAPATTQ